MGSVTELSLLFISSNCWSMMSPASLSVSLLAQALWEKCGESQSERGSVSLSAGVYCVVPCHSSAPGTRSTECLPATRSSSVLPIVPMAFFPLSSSV